MGKLDKLKSQIPQGSQELSTKNHLAKTEIAMSFQNEAHGIDPNSPAKH